MWAKNVAVIISSWLLFLSVAPTAGFAQANGSIRGVVTFKDQEGPLHSIVITIVQLQRSVKTDENGVYEFQQVPPGTYDVIAQPEGFPSNPQKVQVEPDIATTKDFQISLTGPKEEITVTAKGIEESASQSFASVTILGATRLAEESHPSIGEVLDKQPGIAKRSFGPGPSRPVIRGFDGNRVLVLQDGIHIGSIGSQSGDHGEPIDVLSLERLEVVKGPATLLYGSNAIGGVVNAVTGREEHSHKGLRGYFTGLGGTTNNQAGISGGLEYGFGNWLFWGSGSGQRTGDYDTPAGEVPNSKTRYGNGLGGFSWNVDKGFFSLSYGYDNRRYGIPFAATFEGGEEGEREEGPIEPLQEGGEEEFIDLDMRRRDVRFKGGFRNLEAFVNAFKLTLSFSDYQHRELEGEAVGTVFNNNLLIYRGVFDQRRSGRLSGSFGFEGQYRDYEAIGAEALAPPVDQRTFGVFALQEVEFKRVKLQFGGRVEQNKYDPVGLTERSFTGFSGAAGVRFGLWEGGALITNYTHSYRAPALEELYNFGPHIGTLTFEVGNPALNRERGDGIEVSLRHTSESARAQANFFYYNIKDFVFLAPRGEIEDGLPVADYLQSDSRFAGTEVNFDLSLHPNIWLNAGFDYVDAELTDPINGTASGTPLPRIPPLQGRVGLDFTYRGLSIRPEAILSNDQDEVFPIETRTPGYAVFNVLGSYAIPRQHFAHIFTFNAFNLGNRLYRNHLSFIKDLAPEIGRGARLTYTLRFF